jgi:HAD superfamily hydrolase (TIGR01509 family)
MTGGTVQALIFDYGGVLMRTADPAPRQELEQRFGLPPGGASRLVFGSPRWDEAQLGRIDSVEFWADVGQRLELGSGGLEEFRRAFWAGDRLDGDLVALIRYLRDAGYRTALLSNNPADLRQRVQELGIADAFDVVVISGDEGLMKPDPAIFERTLAQVGVRAERAVFVDDSQVHVVAARQVGLQATRFRGLAPLRRWLQGLDVPLPELVLAPLPDVRAVIFDWGGVIEGLPSEGRIAELERRLALASGALSEVLWGELWRRLSTGAIGKGDYVQGVAARLGLPDAETARRLLEELYAGDRFNPAVVAAARALRDRYRVALLTNASPGQDERVLEQFGIDVHTEFDAYVNSAYVGLRKPDPAVFRLTLDQLSVAPQQAVLLDDMLRNVDSARELGIHAVQFVDPDASLAELGALLGHPVA